MGWDGGGGKEAQEGEERCISRVSLVAQLVKNLPAVQETLVQSLGQDDPLEKEIATYSSVLAWRIPWTEEPGGLQSMGFQGVGHYLVTYCTSKYIHYSDSIKFHIMSFICFRIS